MEELIMLEKIKEILAAQLRIDADTITPETDIKEDLGVDSLDVVELLMAIEDECGVHVPDDEIVNFKTVGDVVKYVEDNM